FQVIEPHLNTPEEENEGTNDPLFIMFPHLNNSPLIPSIQNQTASTSELTRHLVAAGGKADFSLMKPASRRIPPRKIWLDSLAEVSSEQERREEGSVSNLASSEEEMSNT
ncbi:unnamed protein product, partial [Timema podura]|nr:unnamed protein product [Timema podura]